ncbi:hypothetical protein FB451DRAFT_1219679 [Mycena latifolia]|nr:hypothetical protein FB451DRAFT_1219679 [Mycena latifolia]
MPNDSDTESESDSTEPIAVPFSDSTTVLNGGTLQTVSNAIEKIRNIELPEAETIVNDTPSIASPSSLAQTIILASETIATFLDDCVHSQAPILAADPHQRQVDFAALSTVSFLTVLFEHRQVFHKIAAQSLGSEPGSSGAVVCWVDAILSKMGDASIPMATGISLDLVGPIFPGSTELRSEDSLRAASQLPVDWPSVIGVVASDKASPAAKRLALRLTFSAFVLGPRLCGRSSSSKTPRELTEVLNRCVNQTRASGFSASFAGDQLAIQERLNFSMIISLFAITDREHRNFAQGAQLRPHTLGCLINMLQNVIHPNDSVLSLQLVIPPENLDPAQIVLLRWGDTDTVSWCWETWDDHGVANTESIVFLTSMWLLHSNRSFPDGTAPQRDFTTASSLAFLRVLHHLVLSLSTVLPSIGPSSVSTTVIFRACQNAVESLKYLLSSQQEDERWIVSGFCRYLFSLFVLLAGETDDELDVNDCILEGLSLVDPATLNVCLMHVIADSTLRFSARLDERVIRVYKALTDNGSLACKLNVVRSALNFAAIVWFSETRGCLLPQSASRLLSATVGSLLRQNSPNVLPLKILGDAVLTASSAARTDPSFPEDNRESIWRFVITSAPSALEIASSFAYYVMTSDGLLSSLYCAEAWRYLGEVLLLILKHHYVEEQEPLALLICPTVCGGLVRLLQADSAAVQFALSTPFTLNLSADLKSVCEGTRSEIYFSVLKERLSAVGARLLDQIMCQSRGVAPETSPKMSMRLMFYRIYGGSHLIFVPDL